MPGLTTGQTLEKLKEGIPAIEAFYNKPKGEPCSQEVYDGFCELYHLMGCRNMGDASGVYCANDVLLLADIFERFRKTMHAKFNLDPAMCISLAQ